MADGSFGGFRELHPESADSLMAVVTWTERKDFDGLGGEVDFRAVELGDGRISR